MSTNEAGLIALVVDDELPALSDLGYLLERDERIARDPVVARDVEQNSSEAASPDLVDLNHAHQVDEPRYTAAEWQQLHQDDARRR